MAEETETVYSQHTAEPEIADQESERHWLRQYEYYLHQAKTGPLSLQIASVATGLAETLHYNHQQLYRLDAFCIMPNHLHVILLPLPTTPVPAELAVVQNDSGQVGYVQPTVTGTQFIQLEYHALAKIMHRVKRRSARLGNECLGRTGEFWEHESYDHWIRDHDEWQRTINYVRNNPVSAGLVRRWEDWPWTFVREA